MSSPGSALIASLKGSDDLSEASVHGIRSQIVPPAVVIRPDEPWREPSTYCDDLQHWVAVAAVTASDSESGIETLHDLTTAIIRALPADWEFVSVGGPIIDESTGTAFLVAPVRLNYRGEEAA